MSVGRTPSQPRPLPLYRWLLVEHLNDVVYAIQTTSGCHAYVRDAEGLTSLRQFAYGSNTRCGTTGSTSLSAYSPQRAGMI